MALADGYYHACHLYGCLLRGGAICGLWNADILYLSSHLWLFVLEVRTEERGGGDSYHTLSSSIDTPFTACLPRPMGHTLPHPHQVHELYRTNIRQLRQCAQLHRTVGIGKEIHRTMVDMDCRRHRTGRTLPI